MRRYIVEHLDKYASVRNNIRSGAYISAAEKPKTGRMVNNEDIRGR